MRLGQSRSDAWKSDGALEPARPSAIRWKPGSRSRGLLRRRGRSQHPLRDFELRQLSIRGPSLRWRCGTGCAWRNPWPRNPAEAVSASSTRLTLSKNSAQSTSDMSRMLVMMLRTVTFDAPWRWCSSCSSCSELGFVCASSSSSHSSAGVIFGILVAQSMHQLHGERRRQCRRPALATARSASGSTFWPLTPSRRSATASASCRASAARDDALRDAPQVFHQHDAQRDRHRPQLADGQRFDGLIGAHEAPQGLGIEAAVGVRDECPGDAEHARKSGERSVGELGQLAIEARRQVLADLADLFFDHVVVVEHPLGGRRDAATFVHRAARWNGRPRAVPFRCCAGERASERPKPGLTRDGLGGGERLRACCSSRSMLKISSRRICSSFQCEPTERRSRIPLRNGCKIPSGGVGEQTRITRKLREGAISSRPRGTVGILSQRLWARLRCAADPILTGPEHRRGARE